MSRQALCVVGDFFNLGDAFLAQAEAEYLLHDRGLSRVAVLPFEPPPSDLVAHFGGLGIDVWPLRPNMREFIAECRHSDAVIGGGLMVRDSVAWGWLLAVAAGCVTARSHGRRVSMVGVGASPVTHRSKRLVWWFIALLCNTIRTRERSSAQWIRQLGPWVARKVAVADDVAFLATPPNPETNSVARTCVISPAHDPTQPLTVDPDKIVELLEVLRRDGGIDAVRVVAHDTRAHLDAGYSEDLVRYVADRTGLPVELANGESGSRLLSAYVDAEVVVTARLHGLIIGALLGKRVIYLPEAGSKLTPFAERFGYPCLADSGVATTDGTPIVAALEAVDLGALDRARDTARDRARTNFAAY